MMGFAATAPGSDFVTIEAGNEMSFNISVFWIWRTDMRRRISLDFLSLSVIAIWSLKIFLLATIKANVTNGEI